MSRKKGANDWQEVSRRILDALDIRAEYITLGVDVTGREPNTKGWLACRAYGREDRNPSAEINVGNGPGRGRYRDFSSGFACGFFDFAAKAGGHSDWKAARKHYAEKVGVELPKGGKAPADTSDRFAWREWVDGLVAAWCMKKPGTTVEAVRMAGGRLGSWPVPSKHFHVIAVPIYGKNLDEDEPVGWVAWNRTGQPLMIPQGEGRPGKPAKTITPKHAPATWVGTHGVQHLDTAEVVWKVEGITDLLALMSMIPPALRNSHVVLTNPNGCNENPNDDQLASLAGKVVYVIHDADKPGQGIPSENQPPNTLLGARRWSNAIAGVAKECRNVQLPYAIEEKHGKDLRDWLNEGHTYAELLEMARATPIVKIGEFDEIGKPVPAVAAVVQDGDFQQSDDDQGSHEASGEASGETNSSEGLVYSGNADTFYEEQICRAIQLDVLGELSSGRVKVFSLHHRKSEMIQSVPKLTYADFLRICGPPAKENLNQSNTPVPDQFTVAQARDAISLLAGYRRIKDEREVGLGCWQGKSVTGEPTDTVVLVNAGEAARLNGDAKLRKVMSPRSDGLLLDLSGSVPWFDFEKLSNYIAECQADSKWAEAVIDETSKLFGRWAWKHQEITPDIVTGLILATWVQTLWEWRPLVSVVGPSNSGKSVFFDAMNRLFGGLSIRSDQSSEAGIRQAIGNSAATILCDEFEEDAHRERILKFFRTASRGSKVLRGNTTPSSGGESYGLKHIPWVAAIEVGLKREPDRNRFINLELVPPPPAESNLPNAWGKLKVPPESYMHDLGQRLLAVAISYVGVARKLAVRLKEFHHHGVDSRVIESYAVPAAMLSAFAGFDDLKANGVLGAMLDGVERIDQGRADESDLIDDIMASAVDCGRSVKYTVSQLLSSSGLYNDHESAIEAHGVGVVLDRAGSRKAVGNDDHKMLFIYPRSVTRKLLRGTAWENQSIDQLLKRAPGAEKSRRMLAGSNVRGVTIPMSYIESEFIGEPVAESSPANGQSTAF